MALQPSLLNLAQFLKSFLTSKQIEEVITLLRESGSALDPESADVKPGPQKPTPPTILTLLDEMDAAYSVQKFSPLNPEESRRVRDAYPGFIERCSANQGRHLVKMLREKLGQY